MKWCTRIQILDRDGDTITRGDIIDISIVGDDHQFGVIGTELHFEALMEPDNRVDTLL
jgi:hypothetical protein